MLKNKYIKNFNTYTNKNINYLKEGTWIEVKSKNCGFVFLGKFINKKNNQIFILDSENDYRVIEAIKIKICNNMKIDENFNIKNENINYIKS